MAGTKKSPKKRTVAKKAAPKPSYRKVALTVVGRVAGWLVGPFVRWFHRIRKNRAASAHKSFTLTRRRDKPAKPKLEGYIAFSWYVNRILWNHKWMYVKFLTLFVALSVAILGVLQVTNTDTVNRLIDATTTGESGSSILDPVARATVVVSSGLSGVLTTNLSDMQYLFLASLYVVAVLVMVWLVRHQLAGKSTTLRTALYSAGAPVVALYALVAVGVLQVIPFALVALVYITALSAGFLEGGIDNAMFDGALILTGVITLYFMTTTFFALFIATIPGTYPMKAYRTARQIVAGQRLRLLLRMVWMVVVILIMWFLVLVPVVIIVNSFSGAGSFPIALAFQVMIAASVIYATAYMYLLYRRMIDDPVVER